MTQGEFQPGDWVVVLGASGGRGYCRCGYRHSPGGKSEWRWIGAVPVWRFAESWGPWRPSTFDTEDVKDRIKEITGKGADVVLDPVGGDVSEQALRSIAWGGRFVVIGFASR